MTLPADARAAATRAAMDAGVVVSVASARDIGEVVGLCESTWGVGHTPDASFLMAMTHAGSAIVVARRVGAADPDGSLVGVVIGFLGWDRGLHLHSHMAAVRPGERGAGIGFALKLAQRAACLERGIDEIRWTFDPLIRRNAHLNLVKLGAEVTHYHPDFYGILDDAISGRDHSDRFEVSWRLASPRVEAAISGASANVDGAEDAPRFMLDADYESLRAEHPEAAAAQRTASRGIFSTAFAEGLRPEFTGGAYVFQRPAP